MTSFVDIEDGIEIEFDVTKMADTLLASVLEMEECPYEACVNLLVTFSEQVEMMNRQFRNIESTTDVLSFPALEFSNPGDFSYAEEHEADAFDPETGELMLGDIVINIDRVISQSEEYGHSFKREFCFLMTHSLLHLCGYDHMTEDEAKVMEMKQEKVLTDLGITRN